MLNRIAKAVSVGVGASCLTYGAIPAVKALPTVISHNNGSKPIVNVCTHLGQSGQDIFKATTEKGIAKVADKNMAGKCSVTVHQHPPNTDLTQPDNIFVIPQNN